MKKPGTPTRVVILGAGFGGLECCKRLRGGEDLAITLIDRQNHHLFQPLLYQVATAGLSAPDIAQPVRAILAGQKNVTILMEEVSGIDLKAQKVITDGREVLYDYLVLGLGVKPGYMGHDEWKPFAPGLKRLSDATRIRTNVLSAFERAETCADSDEVARLMTVVVIGGGPTGVELAGAFAELARKALRKTFRHIDTAQSRIVLVEAASRILGTYSIDLSQYAENKLARMGVEVRTGAPVTEIGRKYVKLGGETIRAENIFWSAGIEAPSLTRDLGVEVDKAGRVLVKKDLSIPGHENAFAIGDIAHCVDGNGVFVPPLAPAAIQMGRHVAGIIRRERNVLGEDLTPYAGLLRGDFTYLDKGTMATIGRSAAVATSMGVKFRGLVAWFMWLFIHLLLLVGLRNKLAVLLHWFWAYLRYQPGARIILETETDGVQGTMDGGRSSK